MPPIDLLPPPRWRDEPFPFSDKHMKNFQRYIAAAISLPITLEDCQQDLGLSASTMDEIKDDLVPVVKICASIREHCLGFKMDLFPKIVSLALQLASYAETLSVYYVVLLRSVSYLTQTNDGVQVSYMNRMMNVVIDDKSSQLSKMVDHAQLIMTGLRELESQINTDKSDLGETHKTLDDRLAAQRGLITELKQQIKTLTEISRIDPNKEADLFRVPLVGFLPRTSFINDQDRKEAVSYIYRYLSPDERTRKARDTGRSLELVQLQVELTQRDLDKITDLIQPIIDTIQSLTVPFQALFGELNALPEKVRHAEGIEAKDLIGNTLDTISQEWRRLEMHARWYAQQAWINPVGANVLL